METLTTPKIDIEADRIIMLKLDTFGTYIVLRKWKDGNNDGRDEWVVHKWNGKGYVDGDYFKSYPQAVQKFHSRGR